MATYETKQKRVILEILKSKKNEFQTVGDLIKDLANLDINVSYPTIYRFLDKLEQEGNVVRISSTDGKRSLFRYVALDEEGFSHGRMVCLECGKIIPLECTQLETFYDHVQSEHGCELDYKRTVLYCTCAQCLAKRKEAPQENK